MAYHVGGDIQGPHIALLAILALLFSSAPDRMHYSTKILARSLNRD